MVKVLFGRPSHVIPCLIKMNGGSIHMIESYGGQGRKYLDKIPNGVKNVGRSTKKSRSEY